MASNARDLAVSGVPASRWVLFAVISAIFFMITGATFGSLGVVLPHMIKELSWTWTQAGTGFSVLAFMVGLGSPVPAWVLRHFGIKATYGVGGAVMVSGFVLLALTNGFPSYVVATMVLGLGFASCATIPAVYLLNGWMPERRSAAIGAFMTLGGLGQVAGPLVAHGVVSVTDSWRFYWWAAAVTLLVLTALALVSVKSPPTEAWASDRADPRQAERTSKRVYKTGFDWRFRDAIRTPQYWLIAAAMTGTLVCVASTSNWAPAHMSALGVSAGVAAGMLSAGGAVNVVARALGGALATRIDPKWLLVAAVAAEASGMAALSVADNWVTLVVFAVGEGFGFGMCMFATAILLVNYYGTSENPEIFATFNLITTVATVGPIIGGVVADKFGGFGGVFQAYAVMMLAIVVVTALMRPPGKMAQTADGSDG